ncbi:Acyl-CoA hydrolase [Bertholletia excelsa]
MATEKPSAISPTDLSSDSLPAAINFLIKVGLNGNVPSQFQRKDFFSELFGALLKIDCIERGSLSCFLTVKPPAMNAYGGLHGGSVASVAELVSIACAKTVVGKDKEIFLGELGISYVSAAPRNAVLKIDARVVRSGKNVAVIATEFKNKDSGRLAFISRATFYNMPIASL